MKCESCGNYVGKIYEVARKWICENCIPDDIFKLYPGWKRRVLAEKKK
jgi:hypothetical protein